MKKIASVLEGDNVLCENVEATIAFAYKQKIGPLISTLILEKKSDLSSDIKNKIHDDLETFRRKVDFRLEYASQIEVMFREMNVTPVFVKGFVLSQIIYGNPYNRQHGDIDVLVENSAQVAACKLAHALSFEERYANSILKYVNEATQLCYLGDCWEKEFVNHVSNDIAVYLEIKDFRTRLNPEMANTVYEHLQKCTIHKQSYTTLDEIYSYLYLINTAYDNFTDEGSFGRENTVRDLYDIMNFTNKIADTYNLLEEARKVNLEKEFLLMLLMTDRVFKSFELKQILNKWGENLYDLCQNELMAELEEIYHNMLLFQKNYYDEVAVCNDLRQGSNKYVHKSLSAVAYQQNLFSMDASRPCFSACLEQPRCYLSSVNNSMKYGAVYTDEEVIHYLSFDVEYKSLVMDLGILGEENDTGYQKAVIEWDGGAINVNSDNSIYDFVSFIDEECHRVNISFKQKNKHPGKVYYEYIYLIMYIDQRTHEYHYRPVASLGKRENNNNVYYPIKLRVGRY